MPGSNGYAGKPPNFLEMTTEETQDHFLELRQEATSNTKRHAVRIKEIDIDEQFQRLLTIVDREIIKLMVISHETNPLDVKNHEAVVAYTKLVGGLKKQMAAEMADTNPEDLQKIAHED